MGSCTRRDPKTVLWGCGRPRWGRRTACGSAWRGKPTAIPCRHPRKCRLTRSGRPVRCTKEIEMTGVLLKLIHFIYYDFLNGSFLFTVTMHFVLYETSLCIFEHFFYIKCVNLPDFRCHSIFLIRVFRFFWKQTFYGLDCSEIILAWLCRYT